MRALLVLFLLNAATACAEPETTGRSDTIRWFTWPGEPELAPETVDAVEDIYGLEFVRSEKPSAAVTFYFDESPQDETDFHGASSGLTCSPHTLIRTDTVRVVAHEVGHAYGLNHTDERENLMFPSVSGGDALNDEQLDKVRESAWRLEELCLKKQG